MRNYNARKEHKRKVHQKRKKIFASNYWPTMPLRKGDNDGLEYYTEGSRSPVKQKLKRQSNKKIRSSKLDKVTSPSHYKKVYDLWWNWF